MGSGASKVKVKDKALKVRSDPEIRMATDEAFRRGKAHVKANGPQYALKAGELAEKSGYPVGKLANTGVKAAVKQHNEAKGGHANVEAHFGIAGCRVNRLETYVALLRL
ncbi:hypothetical protein LTR37_007087 [Vermiconidia calcicola]|uniref:Uncharacterized protein n=1 Tax=Vermiconidia calcicola TaxID=1690605 RepID=A0ACC3NGI7_9PEZI|nr:hypothetical protein LTR37_007087 [Vermiconidia calcicola]